MINSILTDDMSYDEVFKRFQEDVKIVNHKIEATRKDYIKAVTKSRSEDRIYYKPIRFSSARGFNYVLVYFNKGINYASKDRLGCFYYVWYRQRNGIYVMTLSLLNQEFWHVTFYTPHFFSRYRERFLKDESFSVVETIHEFIINNLKRPSITQPSEKYPDGYWEACPDGLCLCRKIGGLTIEAKTFITWNMLGKNQNEVLKGGKEMLIEKGFELVLPEENMEESSFGIDD